MIAPAVACGLLGLVAGWLVEPLATRASNERGAAATSHPLARRGVLAVVTATLFALTGTRLGWSPSLPAYLILAGVLVALSLIDLETRKLPRLPIYWAGVAGVALLGAAAVVLGTPGRIVGALVGALLALVVLWVLHLLARGAFGFGDVRLGVLLGWYLGWLRPGLALAGIVLAFVLSAAASVVLLATRRVKLRAAIPFGPFLAASAIVLVLVVAPTL